MSVFDAVCQIVAYEAGYGQPDEHVKAQAVATYTYIKYHGGNLSAGVKTTVTEQIKRCVAEVIGYAVLDDRSDRYILATYFSESCGETASAEWVSPAVSTRRWQPCCCTAPSVTTSPVSS